MRQGDGNRVTNFRETGGIELVQDLLPMAGRNHPELIRDRLELRRIFGREIARLAAYRASGAAHPLCRHWPGSGRAPRC